MDGQEMQFNEADRQAMLQLKGVGETVISRIEQLGFYSLTQLQNQEAEIITKQTSQMIRSTCWHNSPQARASIQAVIDLAKQLG
jgi:hypothetical protein